jgi:ribosomal protein S27AE
LILKPRSKPLKVPVCETAERRLDPYHPKLPIIRTELATYSSGYHGEKSFDYHLSTLPKDQYYLIHGLRLKNDLYHSQIDTALFTTRFIYTLEVKNYAGDLFLDTPLNQLVQMKNNNREVYPCPILQAQRQKFELENWIKSHHFKAIPIEYLVVFTNQRCYLQTHPGHDQVFEQICKSPDIKNRTGKLERKYTKDTCSMDELFKLCRTLLKHHVRQSASEVFKEYKIDLGNIITGVQCPKCEKFAMKYHDRTWICPHCHFRSKTAHVPAVCDYFLLIEPTITNEKLRNFLHLPNARVANRILKSLGLEYTGNCSSRVYYAPREFPYYQ